MNNNDIFTSVIRVKGSSKYKLVPVKSSEPVEREKWIEFSKVISRLYANLPISMGDTICKNVLNTGIDIVCTRTLSK